MAYLNRNNIEKFWPIERKGTKYLAVASHNKKDSIPLLVVMRDILKTVRNKKELKKIIHEKQIKINHKEIRETNYPISLFDVLTLGNKNYQAILSEHKKIKFNEVSDKDSETKIFKIINKKLISGNKIQLNLMHGKNLISSEKANTGDSVLLSLKDNKIIKVIPMEKGKNAFVIQGKHTGIKGKIEELMIRGGKSLAKISSEKEKINVWTKNIVVIE
jgi:small subunit ribosomal protein S4e